jgi:hypothetical protein
MMHLNPHVLTVVVSSPFGLFDWDSHVFDEREKASRRYRRYNSK